MRFIFPCDYFDKKKPDEMYQAQYEALKAIGADVSTIDLDDLENSKIVPTPKVGEIVVYRGWMLNADKYAILDKKIQSSQAEPFTNINTYLFAHHLPNWYPLIKAFTSETVLLSKMDDLEYELNNLGWDGFFVKDYVKSLKTSIGSVVRQPKEIDSVVAEMEKFKGEIEGGLCIRRVEEYSPDTEKRYFVILGHPFAAGSDETIPNLVKECANIIASKFFSVDIITRTDGVQRIVEIGDGQVSDIVGWTPTRFAEIWQGFI
ncbi:MAG: ATP-grasp domain-containing protein [Candidatus Thiodiazotropha sp.]